MEVFCPDTHHSSSTTINIEIPHNSRIGVFVSGGMDSTLLYYLLLKEHQLTKSASVIYPIIIMRKADHAHHKIIGKINQIFNYQAPTLRFGNTTLAENKQVESAIIQSFTLPPYIQAAFIGLIQVQKEHAIGIEMPITPQHSQIFTPLQHVDKSHIVALYYRFGISELLTYTFSCDVPGSSPCGICNGCRERQWGFLKTGRIDPCTML